jgi:hypothetical protein
MKSQIHGQYDSDGNGLENASNFPSTRVISDTSIFMTLRVLREGRMPIYRELIERKRYIESYRLGEKDQARMADIIFRLSKRIKKCKFGVETKNVH